MGALQLQTTLDGQHSAHCGLCWSPVFNLWAGREAPDYTACPLGPYTPQTCPNETGRGRMISDLRAAVAASQKSPVSEGAL